MEVAPGMAVVVEVAMVAVAAAGVVAEVALAAASGVEAALGVDAGAAAASAAAAALGVAAVGVDMGVAAAGPRSILPFHLAWARPHPSMALTGTPLLGSLLGLQVCCRFRRQQTSETRLMVHKCTQPMRRDQGFCT